MAHPMIARHGGSCIQYSGAAVESMNGKHVALPHLFGRSRGCGPEEALARGGRT
jgi:hypothetical protein